MVKYRYFGPMLRAQAKWLNKMARRGWRLADTGKLDYSFVPCEPGEYQYAVDYVGNFSRGHGEDYAQFLAGCGYRTWFKTVNLQWSRGKVRWNPAGEPGAEGAVVLFQGLHGEAHRPAHPGEDGDLPGGALGDAQGGLLPGDHPGEGPHGHQQIVALVAQLGHPLQDGFLLHGPAECAGGGAGGLVFRCMQQTPLGRIAARQYDQILSRLQALFSYPTTICAPSG